MHYLIALLLTGQAHATTLQSAIADISPCLLDKELIQIILRSRHPLATLRYERTMYGGIDWDSLEKAIKQEEQLARQHPAESIILENWTESPMKEPSPPSDDDN